MPGVKFAPIFAAGKKFLTDFWMYSRIGRIERHRATTLRAQQHDPAGEGIHERLRERRQIRLGRERSRNEQQLDVRNPLVRAAFNKGGDAPRQFGSKARTLKKTFPQCDEQSVSTHGPQQRTFAAATINEKRRNMILQVFANSRQSRFHWNAVRGQFGGIANAG